MRLDLLGLFDFAIFLTSDFPLIQIPILRCLHFARHLSDSSSGSFDALLEWKVVISVFQRYLEFQSRELQVANSSAKTCLDLFFLFENGVLTQLTEIIYRCSMF